MAGVDRKIKRKKKNEKDELVLNTSFNRFVILNFAGYVVNLYTVFAFGAYGRLFNPTNTTILLSSTYQTILTPSDNFFTIIWGLILGWQGFWIGWQMLPSQRNCEGLVTAAYHYPFAALLQLGYTASASFGTFWLGCVFVYAVCGTMVAATMSLQRYKGKTWKEYLLWQGPLSINTGWIMVEAALMTNAIFVAMDETTTIKVCIGVLSLLTLIITAMVWLMSYPVDFAIPLVILYALGGMDMALKDPEHVANLTEQGFRESFLKGIKYGILASVIVVASAILMKLCIVILFQRPAELKAIRERAETSAAMKRGMNRGKEAPLHDLSTRSDDDHV